MRKRTYGTLMMLAACVTVLSAQPGPPPPPRPPQLPPPPPQQQQQQGGQAQAGAPLRGLTIGELTLFNKGRDAFEEVDAVADGLGPRFNLDSCVGCHSQPAAGGSSPAVNPQIAVATRMGALNRVPSFLQLDGPVRVARFRRKADGTPDGGVHSLFTIAGRGDAPGDCRIAQPDFTNAGNIVFRIPTPVFGLGLIEAIPDSTLRANLASNAASKLAMGIGGRFNTNGNDGTITRFGWKAQNKSLLLFSGEAYNVEVGITNELFPQEREEDEACAVTASTEDRTDTVTGEASDVELFAQFMRWLAPPRPAPSDAAIERGRALFASTGCAACHTPLLRTGRNASAALNAQDVALYSDLALHRMGDRLNDGVAQGDARGDDWRTAPLWGLGQRLFFLHDGRTRDLTDAIRQHDSPNSEARQVVGNFNALPAQQMQDLLAFLRSL